MELEEADDVVVGMRREVRAEKEKLQALVGQCPISVELLSHPSEISNCICLQAVLVHTKQKNE